MCSSDLVYHLPIKKELFLQLHLSDFTDEDQDWEKISEGRPTGATLGLDELAQSIDSASSSDLKVTSTSTSHLEPEEAAGLVKLRNFTALPTYKQPTSEQSSNYAMKAHNTAKTLHNLRTPVDCVFTSKKGTCFH